MPFSDPIPTVVDDQGQLVPDYIQSAGFDPAVVQGWQITRDGYATFSFIKAPAEINVGGSPGAYNSGNGYNVAQYIDRQVKRPVIGKALSAAASITATTFVNLTDVETTIDLNALYGIASTSKSACAALIDLNCQLDVTHIGTGTSVLVCSAYYIQSGGSQVNIGNMLNTKIAQNERVMVYGRWLVTANKAFNTGKDFSFGICARLTPTAGDTYQLAAQHSSTTLIVDRLTTL